MENGGKAVRYECTRCGACCRWAGDVCIETDEIHEISRFLNMDEQVFIDTCCRLRANRRGLSIRDAEDGACMMLTKDGCRINPVKPRQCRDFPNKWNFPGWREKWGRNGKHNICRDAARFFSSSGIIPWTG